MPVPFRSLADIGVMEAAPMDSLGLPQSTFEMFQRSAKSTPNDPALIFIPSVDGYENGSTYTYRTFLERVTQSANVFHGVGIRAGQAVSYLLPLLPQTHFVLWGAQAAGIANPVNPLIEAAQIAEIVQAAESTVLVTLAPSQDGGELWNKVVKAFAHSKQIRHIFLVACSEADDLGQLAKDLPDAALLDYDACLANATSTHLISGRVVQADDIATYFHTGGTTGTPKLAQHTHRNEIISGWQFGQLLDLPPDARLLCGMPLFHVNGAIITGVTPFLRGQCVVLACPSGFRTPGLLDRFWKIVERYRVSMFSAVPTLLIGLLAKPVDADVGSLKYVVCGAAPLPVEVLRQFEAATGVRILEGYGLTEGTCGSTMNPRDGERRPGSIGLRFPYQPLRVVEVGDDGAYVGDCAVDKVGVIVLSGPNVFPGYRQEIHNKGVWLSIDGQHWLNTGDMGRIDADGYVWLAGRKKELIIRGGHNIDPKTIEDALHRHPSVQIAAAVGRPDAYAGELPVAYVALKPGCAITEQELLDFAAKTVPERAAIPKSVTVLPALPVTAVGKLFKPALREREAIAVCSALLESMPDVPQATVSARTDAKLGLVVCVVLGAGKSDPDALRQRISAELGRYAWAVELVIDDVAG